MRSSRFADRVTPRVARLWTALLVVVDLTCRAVLVSCALALLWLWCGDLRRDTTNVVWGQWSQTGCVAAGRGCEPEGTWVSDDHTITRDRVGRDCWPCLHHQVRAFAPAQDLASLDRMLVVTSPGDLAWRRALGWLPSLAVLPLVRTAPWWSPLANLERHDKRTTGRQEGPPTRSGRRSRVQPRRALH